MNYGRKKAAKKRKDITSKSKMKRKRLGVRIFKGALLTFLLLIVAGCVGGGIFIKKGHRQCSKNYSGRCKTYRLYIYYLRIR